MAALRDEMKGLGQLCDRIRNIRSKLEYVTSLSSVIKPWGVHHAWFITVGVEGLLIHQIQGENLSSQDD